MDVWKKKDNVPVFLKNTVKDVQVKKGNVEIVRSFPLSVLLTVS